MLTNPR